MTDRDILLAIQQLLDGREWSVDDLDRIAQLLNSNGYPVRDVADMQNARYYGLTTRYPGDKRSA